jgi:hypothetical protein
MRKHAMILALVLALTMGLVFIGCGGNLGQLDATDADNVVDTKGPGDAVWTLSEVLETIGAKKLSLADIDDGALDGTPLQTAASPDPTGDDVTAADKFSMEIKQDDEAGHLVVQIYTGKNAWGAGLDVEFGIGLADKFQFLAGDTITVTGKALDFSKADKTGNDWASSLIMLKLNGDDPALDDSDDIEKDAPFEFQYRLSGGDIVKLNNGGQYGNKCIRVGARPMKVSFQITDIVVSRN